MKDNEYINRSTGDVVSKLAAPIKYLNSVLYPNWTKEHMLFIDDKTGNPITEHKPDILDRLDENKVIGRGAGFNKRSLKCYTINDEMSGGCDEDNLDGGSWGQSQWIRFINNHQEKNNMT